MLSRETGIPHGIRGSPCHDVFRRRCFFVSHFARTSLIALPRRPTGFSQKNQTNKRAQTITINPIILQYAQYGWDVSNKLILTRNAIEPMLCMQALISVSREVSMIQKHLLAVVLLFFVALFTTLPVFGGTITVMNTNDNGTGSLRDAITTANSGDTISFNLSYPATIALSSTLNIGTSLKISGPGASKLAISGNNAVGVFAVASGVTVSISGVTIENGNASYGGGIFNMGTTTLTNSTVSGNVATILGGGIDNIGMMTVTNSTFSGNSAYIGGGICNPNPGTMTVTSSTISGNSANQQGGGIYNSYDMTNPPPGTMTVTNTTFSGNSASQGGGIFNYSGTMTVTNTTISGNVTSYRGGGIMNYYSGTMTVANTTISGNSAPPGSIGGIYNDYATLTLKTTIVASSIGGNCLSSGPAPASDGYDLSDDASCFAFLTSLTDQNNIPAGLDPTGLQNNGGPTQTIALLPTSPAVDAIPIANCTLPDGVTPVLTDQRGVLRPQLPNGECSIGAYEFATANSLLDTLRTQIQNSIPGGNKVDQAELKLAAAELSTALAAKNWTGTGGNGLNKNNALLFFLEEGAAAVDLTLVLNNEHSSIPPQTVQTDLNNLALANRVLTTAAIANATAKNPKLLAQANALVAAGDQATNAGKYGVAIADYSSAWELAEIAL